MSCPFALSGAIKVGAPSAMSLDPELFRTISLGSVLSISTPSPLSVLAKILLPAIVGSPLLLTIKIDSDTNAPFLLLS